jgi:hypothetical protein
MTFVYGTKTAKVARIELRGIALSEIELNGLIVVGPVIAYLR